MAVRQRTLQIRQFIIDSVGDSPKDIARVTAKHFGITAQSARNHLTALVDQGVLEPPGKTRAREYKLKAISKLDKVYQTDGLMEDIPWMQDFKPLVDTAPSNVVTIVGLAFTEMLNNAIDHSGSGDVFVTLVYTAATITCRISDSGVGIFKKVKQEKGLIDERHAILELEKGRLTTSPENHTGFGIYFTSRMVDIFSMGSGSLFFMHFQRDSDWLIEVDHESFNGTFVEFTIAINQTRTATEVYDMYCPADEDGLTTFSTTHVPLSLAKYGSEQLVSRSQAKRVLVRFDEFKEVLLDFSGVDMVGQGFADQIFRVFANENPSIKLRAINANEAVSKMIRLAVENRDKQRQLPLFD